MRRALRLRREALLDLTPADLAAIVGGQNPPTLDPGCIPIITSGRFTEATCTW